MPSAERMLVVYQDHLRRARGLGITNPETPRLERVVHALVEVANADAEAVRARLAPLLPKAAQR